MRKKLRELQARKAQLVQDARGIVDKADVEKRDLNEDEAEKFDELKIQNEAVGRQIERETLLIAEEGQLGMRQPNGSIVMLDAIENDPKRGFRTFGEFCQAVLQGSIKRKIGGDIDPRLKYEVAAPSTFGGEGVGPDGGFAVPPDFATEIFTHALGEDSLLPLTDQTTVTGNSMVFPKDETTPWGTDGIRAYWQQEAAAATATKPKLSNTTLRLYKLMALIPLTDELLDDTNALSTYLPRKVGDSIRWKTNEAIMFGSGAGQPLGAFNGNAVITVVKEAGQATLTLQALNIAKMIARPV